MPTRIGCNANDNRMPIGNVQGKARQCERSEVRRSAKAKMHNKNGQRCYCWEQTSTCAVNAQTFSPSIVIPSFCAWRDCSVKART